MRQRMCLLHNFMQSSLCILTKEQIRIVKFNADFLATMLKINTQIPTGCRNNAQSTQSQSPAILSQSHLGNQKPNPYNGENKSGGTHANHDKGKKKGRAAPWPQRPGRCKSQPSAAAALYPGNHRLYPVQLYTDGSAVIIPFKNYKFSKGILGSDWCGLANFKWIIQSVALDRALRNTVLYGLLFMVLSPVTNVIIALLLFEITSRRRLKTYQTIITFPNFMSMVIVGYIVYAILSPRTGLMNQIIQFFGGDPVDVYMNPKYWPFILTVVNLWKGIGMGSMMYFAALMGIDTSLYEAAEIDGASRFQKMLHISLPHLVPLICIFTIMNAGSLISGNFDLFYVIPRNTSTLYATTDILNTYVYRSLQESSYAIGATTGLIQSVVGMFLVLLSNWIVKKISPDNSMF